MECAGTNLTNQLKQYNNATEGASGQFET